jgi:hypothetical protein
MIIPTLVTVKGDDDGDDDGDDEDAVNSVIRKKPQAASRHLYIFKAKALPVQ